MPQGIPQTSFTVGELAPSLYGRIDIDLYYKALAECRNMIVSKYGGVDNRPGAQFITKVNDSTNPVRLIPFQYNGQQQYVLELGNYTLRIIQNGTVLESGGVPIVVTTPWPATEIFKLKYTQSADVLTVCHQLYPTQQVERSSATSWVCTPFLNVNGPFQDINANPAITVYASATSGAGVTLTASADLFTADLVGLEFYMQQSPDNTTAAWEVSVAKSINNIVIFGNNYYQALTAGATGTIGPTVTVGSARDGDPGVLWKYLHSGFGIVKITGVASSTLATCTVLSQLPDSMVSATALVHITNVVTGDPDVSQPAIVTTQYPNTFATNDQLTLSGIVGAIEANGSFVITVMDSQNFMLNNLFTTSAYVSGGVASKTNVAVPTYYWALPAWGALQEYPATSSYFQDRQIFGGTVGQPSTIFMSTTAGFLDFSVGNPVLDSDAITYKVLSNQVNSIRHMLELQYLIIFTSGGIYMVEGGKNGANGVVTPSTVNLTFQGANPVSDVQPLRIANYAMFVQEKGTQVRTLGYSFAENAFIGQDTTTMSNHLLQFWTIVDWCYQEIPYSCIWAVRSDGVLLGLTFNPEQQITGWHHHDTQGTYESICCITENNVDTVYTVVNRVLNGTTTRVIERFQPRQFLDQRDAYFVDCGLTYDGRGANTYASTFSGLDHLEGQVVSILGDGIVFPQQTVVNGIVTTSQPVLVAHVGLPYISEITTLPLASGRADVTDKKRNINGVSVIVDRSAGFITGPDANNLTPYKTRTDENYGAPDNLLSEIVDINIVCNWDKKGQVTIRQEKPLPLTVLAVIPQAEIGGW